MARDWRRSIQLRVAMRPGEAADLTAVAEGWGCPVGTAAWAILSGELSRFRRQAARIGEPESVPIFAALAAGMPIRALRKTLAQMERQEARRLGVPVTEAELPEPEPVG